ncbi:hypothetical protein [Actimicrobium sp. CCI2.3]|uniref:hypothetical protein n=1 Tax=Actimicrobium sp. CCI2.3 TaxID=3048616 RepID=UPI002AB34EA9|nr:hypothetical protein [Actimicrobium sp. CCI2.3]MDY7574755.1 hypothetical protein [Actimicrobium sp. CCI2.3]MEB0020284.1 hypothetical protein [Actimicrobium sp. CCI2.3]
MKTSIKALVLALSMIAGSSFAATDLSTLSDFAGAGSTFADTAAAGGLIAGLTIDGADSVAVVAQFGGGNFAAIDQTGINTAIIMQDSTNNPNSAAIIQLGAMNTAKINQR